MHRSNELPALGARAIDDLLPFVGPQLRCGKDRGGYGDRVRRKGEDKFDRKLRPRDGPGCGGADLRIDHNSLASDFKKRELSRRRREIVGSSEQFHQLAPADRPVVRVGCRLRQHRIQAIVETHRDIRFLQDRSIPDLAVRAPAEGGGA